MAVRSIIFWLCLTVQTVQTVRAGRCEDVNFSGNNSNTILLALLLISHCSQLFNLLGHLFYLSKIKDCNWTPPVSSQEERTASQGEGRAVTIT